MRQAIPEGVGHLRNCVCRVTGHCEHGLYRLQCFLAPCSSQRLYKARLATLTWQHFKQTAAEHFCLGTTTLSRLYTASASKADSMGAYVRSTACRLTATPARLQHRSAMAADVCRGTLGFLWLVS